MVTHALVKRSKFKTGCHGVNGTTYRRYRADIKFLMRHFGITKYLKMVELSPHKSMSRSNKRL